MGDEFLLLDEPSIGTTVALMNSSQKCFLSLNILNSTVWIIDTLRSILLSAASNNRCKAGTHLEGVLLGDCDVPPSKAWSDLTDLKLAYRTF
jgi:hypothetical protein